jgi:hypothetical protein
VVKEHDLFFTILTKLDKEEVLQDIVPIGGWCPFVYKEYFGDPVEISMQRTADLDFLVPNSLRIHKDVDVSLILEGLGFDRKMSLLDGYEKYVHPDLEVEFLTPEKGRGKEKPYTIDKLHINPHIMNRNLPNWKGEFSADCVDNLKYIISPSTQLRTEPSRFSRQQVFILLAGIEYFTR